MALSPGVSDDPEKPSPSGRCTAVPYWPACRLVDICRPRRSPSFTGCRRSTLSKALQSLSQAAIVETTLGPSGGYRLAKPASALTFLDIVEAVEGNTRTFTCNNIRANTPCRPKGYCDSEPCAVARIMWQADEAWRSSLRSVLLSDLIGTLSQEIPSRSGKTRSSGC